MKIASFIVATVCCTIPLAHADAVSDWNKLACTIVGDPKAGTPTANRTLAITQTVVYEAVNRITRKYPSSDTPVPDASVDAAVAAANRAALVTLVPTQVAAITAAYDKALAAIPDGPARISGIATGEAAATAVLARRNDDGIAAPESYRPVTVAGVYVPTTIPVFSHWPARKPWLMSNPSQFRPGPPPVLTSALWARDFAEVKAIGRRTNSTRTQEQTDVALFWEATLPSIYHGVVRSVAEQPGREITRNARLFAAVTQGMDDSLVSVFDAKYYYNFWRPITAIRNADIDGNDATERDASWIPLIDTPMHPEYPCAHCILSATVGTVLMADIGNAPLPKLTTTSYLVKDSERSWLNAEDFIQEVAEARIYDGVHYRNSAEVGSAMGRQVGKLAAEKFFGSDRTPAQ